MLKNNIEAFIGCDNSYEESAIVLFGAPFDSTTSFRPGTRFGPSAIRHESFGIETYSPYQKKDLEDYKINDYGNIELPFGNSIKMLQHIEKFVSVLLKDNKIPVMTGGEHLVTLGSVRAVGRKFPGLHLIQFDAHADLRDTYLDEKLSHATVMRRCYDILGKDRIHQFCIRSGDRSEFEFAEEHTDMNMYDFSGLKELTEKLKKEETPVYLTVDLDCLDPSFFPGTGTPEAGGVDFSRLLSGILTVCSGNVVGADITELSPVYDQSGISTATACKILRELILGLV